MACISGLLNFFLHPCFFFFCLFSVCDSSLFPLWCWPYKLLVVSSDFSTVPQSTSRGLVLVQERSGFSILIWEAACRMFISSDTHTMPRHISHEIYHVLWADKLPRWLSGKESTCQCRSYRTHGFDPWVGKIPWRKKWQPTPVFLPWELHSQRSLGRLQSMGCKEVRHG